MPRQRFPLHKFEWPSQIQEAIQKHVAEAISRVSPKRYEQEAAYVAALIARLDGVAYEGSAGRVEFIGTVVTDRGPNSAESRWGADFAITASLTQGERTSHKAVLGQAKRGTIKNLSQREQARLEQQCDLMKSTTSSCLILETPHIALEDYLDTPTVRMLGDEDSMTFADYITDHLIVCTHGDRRPDFVIRASNSRLNSLYVSIDA
jgi:hypothetical protein